MRKALIQALYAWLMESDSPWEVLDSACAFFEVAEEDIARGRGLLSAIVENQPALEKALSTSLEHWSLERVGVVEQAIIYLSLHEITACPDVPLEVAIDEAVRLAKEFSGDESARFVNGVIDALAVTQGSKSAGNAS